MERWRSIFALAVAGALVASPVLAQQSGGGTSPQTGSEQSKPSDAPKPDAAKPSDSSAPAASPKTGSDPAKDATKSDATKPDGAKSDPMKSDKMKSDTMKSGEMKSGEKAAGGNREQVRAAQQALKDKGHDPGSIDGVMGPKTQSALKDYQKAQGLKETGRLDAETMAKLGVDSAAAASPRSSDPSASPGGSAPTQSSKDPTTPAKRPQAR